MNELHEITEAWQWYRKCYKKAQEYPDLILFQEWLAKANMRVLCLEAQYWSGVKPL